MNAPGSSTGPGMRALLTLAALLTAAACGGASTAAPPPASASAQPSPHRRATPGTSGLLAAVSGHTLQVQSSGSQTAVTYSSGTTFTDTVPARLSEVTVGSCVLVRSGGASGSGVAGAATSVAITPAVNGSCASVRGGSPKRRRKSAGAGSGSSAQPAPSRKASAGTSGKVLSTSGTGFVVQTGAAGSTAPKSVPVTTGSATTYSKRAKATSAALVVGRCLTVRGPAGSDGTIAARSIAVRPANSGQCSGGGASNG